MAEPAEANVAVLQPLAGAAPVCVRLKGAPLRPGRAIADEAAPACMLAGAMVVTLLLVLAAVAAALMAEVVCPATGRCGTCVPQGCCCCCAAGVGTPKVLSLVASQEWS